MSKGGFEVAPNIERLTPYVPGKPLEELERELGIRNAVKLASNENPVGPSEAALRAATEAGRQGNRYPDGYKLRADLAAYHAVSLQDIVLGNGSNELIDLLFRAFAKPAAHVVYPDPSFVCYRMGAIATNMEASEVRLRDNLSYDVDALLAAVRPNTQLLFLANPNNPTGAYLGKQELSRLLSSLPSNVIAVMDEAYVEFPDAEDYVSSLSLRSLHENMIVLRTFSKAYGLAAFRIGYGVATPRIVNYIERVKAPFNVSSIALEAARAALADQDHVQRYIAHNRSERARVSNELRTFGLTVAPSQGNFVLVDFARSSKDVYDWLLRKGVIIRPMPAPIATWQRITIGLTTENDRMLESVRALLKEMP
jgi:histidinol-phosphate aminotransferase